MPTSKQNLATKAPSQINEEVKILTPEGMRVSVISAPATDKVAERIIVKYNQGKTHLSRTSSADKLQVANLQSLQFCKRLDIAKHIMESSIDELDELATLVNQRDQQKHSQLLHQFYLDVQELKADTQRPVDMHSIYKNEIALFLAEHQTLNQTKANSLLKGYVDTSPSRLLAKLVTNNQLFKISLKGRGQAVGYPAFQIDTKTGKPKAIIKTLLDTLDGCYKNWEIAFWFNHYEEDIDGTIIDRLDDESYHNTLILLAKAARG